jgi:hypothetical protein
MGDVMPDWLSFGFYNRLALQHLGDVVMVLTAAIVTLADRHLYPRIARRIRRFHAMLRFLGFLLVVGIGYGILTIFTARILRHGLSWQNGRYVVLIALGVCALLAWEAQRQRRV